MTNYNKNNLTAKKSNIIDATVNVSHKLKEQVEKIRS